MIGGHFCILALLRAVLPRTYRKMPIFRGALNSYYQRMSRIRYTALLYLLLPLTLLRLLWRGIRQPDYRQRWGERLGFYGGEERPVRIWIHAVSVGELVAALPLIRRLEETVPLSQMVVTTTTPTGSARVRAALGSAVQHVYLPYDLPGMVARFLCHFRPKVGVVMETEIWPNLFAQCRRRSIPLLLANVRLSQRSLEGYRRWAPVLARETLRQVAWLAVQSEADGDRLRQLGADKDHITITGTIKFDLQIDPEQIAAGVALRRQLGADRPIWIAASTREGEEEIILAAHQRLLQHDPELLLILVPRHPERFDHVARLVERRGLRLQRRTAAWSLTALPQVYLGDTMGELLLHYAAADIAFVGGSLVPLGSHNMLEPAALGLPVLFGLHRFNFAEVSELLLQEQAASEVENGDALVTELLKLLADPQRGEGGTRAVTGRAKPGGGGTVATGGIEAARPGCQRWMRVVLSSP